MSHITFAACVALSISLLACGTKKTKIEAGGSPNRDFLPDCTDSTREECQGFIEIGEIDDQERDHRFPDLDLVDRDEDYEPGSGRWEEFEDFDVFEPEFPEDDRGSRLVLRSLESNLIKGGKLDDSASCLSYARVHHDYGIVLETHSIRPRSNHIGLGDSVRCEIRLELRMPEGYQFAVKQIDTVLRAEVGADSLGKFKTEFGFDEAQPSYSSERSYEGGRLFREWNQLRIHPEEWQWSSCDGKANFNMNIELGVNFKTLPQTPDEWEKALERKERLGSEHGNIQLGGLSSDSQIPLEISWRKCEESAE